MALQSLSGAEVTHIPLKRQEQYEQWRMALAQRFPNAEADIHRELNEFWNNRITQYGWEHGAGFCSSWIPGPNWQEGSGVFQPIFEIMSDLYGDERLAHRFSGWFFGLLLMDVMIHREDLWEFWRENTAPDDDPEGLYYRPVVNVS